MKARRTRKARPAPAFTHEEAHAVLDGLPRLKGVNLDGACVDDQFLEQVRAAFAWATTWPGRCRSLTYDTFYNNRHHAAYDMKCFAMSDASFAVGAALAGWIPTQRYDSSMRPRFAGLRRAAA